ncbi:g5439 [Coccomyxa viridis]|uniref:G5439 protein n=1 Tax=Coccomyxa viridis TaxID=1274662 RepID=A0ABP1FSU4_9CHLO
MEQQTASGPPSLRTLCERIIFRHRDWLGDIGSVPVILLEDCLHACSAQQLSRIEDETSEGGVDISVDLAHHWKRCFEQRFGSFDDSKGEAPVLEAAAQLGSSNAGTVLDWRALYQWREDQYEEKLRASGERLRQRTAAESSGRDSRSIQVLSAVPRRPPAQKGFFRGAAPPGQAPGSRHRLLRKLGMGNSTQSPPARRFRIIRRTPGSISIVNKESTSVGSALQLVESELDLKPSSNPFMPHPLGKADQHDASSKTSSASSGSQALQMTDNRFVFQPAFEERLRSAPERQLPKSSGQLRAKSGQGVTKPSQASGQAARHDVKQISPQPKPQAVSKMKAQQDGSRGAAEQPAKRIKYDHLLGGSALLSLAGKQKKKP